MSHPQHLGTKTARRAAFGAVTSPLNVLAMPPSSENCSGTTQSILPTYPEVKSAPALAPPPEMAPANDRTPNSQERIPEAYDTDPELLVRGRQWIADSDEPACRRVDLFPAQPYLTYRPYVSGCFRELEIWTKRTKHNQSLRGLWRLGSSNGLGLRSLARSTRAMPSKAVW
jgi:hypothetical protein